MSGETSVVGKRLPSWDFRGVFLRIVAVLCLVSPVWWITELVRDHKYRFDEGFVATLGLSVLFFLLLLIGVAGTSGLKDYFRKLVLESDCPRCGAHAIRNFEDPTKDSVPTACGSCIAYLRADGETVREERIEARDTRRTPYAVTSKRYSPAVKPDSHDHIKFELPQLCVICGSSDVTHMRAISSVGVATGESVVLSMVASEIASNTLDLQTRQRMGIAATLNTGGRSSRPQPAPEQLQYQALSQLAFPLCTEHQKTPDATVANTRGTLEFASYRYYKEFLALNRIDGSITG